MTKAQTTSGKVHYVKTSTRPGASVLFCTGRTMNFLLPASDLHLVTCRACRNKAKASGGVSE
jgi:hypothetical protein